MTNQVKGEVKQTIKLEYDHMTYQTKKEKNKKVKF